MEICAVNNFHKLNNQKYCIVDNQEFLIWYNKVLTLGYKSIYSVKDFQVLIDQIVSFFEIKIQDRILENSIIDEENISIELSNTYLSHQEFEELKQNLHPKIVNLLDCHIEPYFIAKDNKQQELEFILFQHNTKTNLRNKLLELIPIALLTSPNTIPKYGYIRAKKFINTFNKEYNLNLNTNEIDELMNSRYYHQKDNSNINEPLIKRLTKKFNVLKKH